MSNLEKKTLVHKRRRGHKAPTWERTILQRQAKMEPAADGGGASGRRDAGGEQRWSERRPAAADCGAGVLERGGQRAGVRPRAAAGVLAHGRKLRPTA